jgi:DNA invertase Pin-like site-specific DNA recombinase
MIYGYARVSTNKQDLDNERQRLIEAGCDPLNIRAEICSTRFQQVERNKLLAELKEGDTLIVTALDRIARSLTDLIHIVNELRKKKVTIKSLRESWLDTSKQDAASQLMLNIFASFAEFERELIRERTLIGLERARREGKLRGRKRRFSKEDAMNMWHLLESGMSKGQVARIYKIDRNGLNRYLKWYPQSSL